MAALIASISSFVTAAAGWVGDWAGTITAQGNEILLLLAVAVPLAGFGIGALRRMININ